MAARRLNARAAVAGSIGAMGLLAVVLSLITAELCQRRALADQREAIAELVGLAAETRLDQLAGRSRQLGLALQAEPAFRDALAARDADALGRRLDAHFHQYFVTAGLIGLQKLVAFDARLNPVATSGEGLATSARTYCPGLLASAARRDGPNRLKMVSGLCLQGGRPLHATLVPVGGLKPAGYVEVVADPLKALEGVADDLGLPLELRRTDGAVAFRSRSWPDGPPGPGTVVAAHTLRGDAAEPVVAVAVLRDVRVLEARFAHVRQVAVAVAAAAALVTALLALMALSGAVLEPIRALHRHVRQVREDRGSLARPVPLKGSSETRELAAAFNDMASALHATVQDLAAANHRLRREAGEKERAQALLQGAREHLERRVAERTATLRRANENLRDQARERRQAELALVGARDQAESAARARSAFLTAMNHRLRTPLNTILGFAGILEDRDDGLTPVQRDRVRQIRAAASSLSDLVDEVLDLARVESDRIDITPLPVDLAPLLADCVEAVRPRARARGIEAPEVTAPPGPVGVRADPERLRRVLATLLSNAVVHNRRRGRVDVTVEPGAAPGGGEVVRVTVADTGQGIPPSRMETVFEPFAGGADRGGGGAGLALARRLVTLMGGRIGAESTPGRGSRFWLELPAAPVPTPSLFFAARTGRAEAPGPGAPASPGAAGAPDASTGPLLLCVEDDPANLALLEELVRRHLPGARLASAATAEAALRLARAERPDAILMDLQLPGMDGLAAVEALKADPATAPIPVLAVSAAAGPEREEAARRAGCVGFVSKPYRFSDLLARLAAALAAPAPPA